MRSSREPTDQLHALRELAEHFSALDLSRTTVVSPDLGNAKNATRFAKLLGTPVAAGAKERFPDDRVRITSIIGDVEGRDIIVLDDEIANGSTIDAIVGILVDRGARQIRIACTHGIFANEIARTHRGRTRGVTEIVTTDTVPQGGPGFTHAECPHRDLGGPGLCRGSEGRIHSGDSVSALFEDHNG